MANRELMRLAKLAYCSSLGKEVESEWNPLESDVEAFELKKTLGLELRTYENGLDPHQYASAHYRVNEGYSGWVHEKINGDVTADIRPVVRRVLVRAAAEIGKQI